MAWHQWDEKNFSGRVHSLNGLDKCDSNARANVWSELPFTVTAIKTETWALYYDAVYSMFQCFVMLGGC